MALLNLIIPGRRMMMMQSGKIQKHRINFDTISLLIIYCLSCSAKCYPDKMGKQAWQQSTPLRKSGSDIWVGLGQNLYLKDVK